MSIYDDTDDCSGTQLYILSSGSDYWAAAEPNSAKYTRILNPQHTFLLCNGCGSFLDGMDVVTGDFGNIHCVFCGSDNIDYSISC